MYMHIYYYLDFTYISFHIHNLYNLCQILLILLQYKSSGFPIRQRILPFCLDWFSWKATETWENYEMQFISLSWTMRSKDHKQILHLQVCCRSRQICVGILRTANCKDPLYNLWCCPSTRPSLPKKPISPKGGVKKKDLIFNNRSQTPTSTQDFL